VCGLLTRASDHDPVEAKLWKHPRVSMQVRAVVRAVPLVLVVLVVLGSWPAAAAGGWVEASLRGAEGVDGRRPGSSERGCRQIDRGGDSIRKHGFVGLLLAS
jgi:hypothetical protein